MDQQETADTSRPSAAFAPCRSVADVSIRDAGDGSPVVMAGYFSVFDTWTNIRSASEGNFMERIAPGAFAKTLSERADHVRVLFQHGKDPSVGQKPLGKILALREDERGAYYEVELFDTDYVRELLPALRSGQLGASFQFQTVRENYTARPQRSAENPKGLPEVTVREVKLIEFGPVTFGAYPEATAGVRSLTDDYMAHIMGGPTELRSLADRLEAAERAESAPTVDDGDGADTEDAADATDDAVTSLLSTAQVLLGALSSCVYALSDAHAVDQADDVVELPRSVSDAAETIRSAMDAFREAGEQAGEAAEAIKAQDMGALRTALDLSRAMAQIDAVTKRAAEASQALADAAAEDLPADPAEPKTPAPSERAAAPEGTAPDERRDPSKPQRNRPRRFV